MTFGRTEAGLSWRAAGAADAPVERDESSRRVLRNHRRLTVQ
jgi:hypothetical protein